MLPVRFASAILRRMERIGVEPHPEIVVDTARVEDAGAILALHRDVLAEREWFITQPHEFAGSIDQKVRQIRDFRRAGNCVFLVARDRGVIVGFLTAQGGQLDRMRHAAKIEIMVARDARDRGVGKALMAAVIAWARDSRHVRKLGLNVFATNERAIALYRAFGFVEEGRRVREYRMEDGTWRDDVLMYLWVDDSG